LPEKSYVECEWRVCASSTDALVYLFYFYLFYIFCAVAGPHARQCSV